MSLKSVIENLEGSVDDALMPALTDMYQKGHGWIRVELNAYGEPCGRYIPYDEVFHSPPAKVVDPLDDMPF